MKEKIKDIEELAKAARKLGLRSIAVGDITLVLGEPRARRTRTQAGEPKSVEEQLPEYTDEQVLFFSTQEEEL